MADVNTVCFSKYLNSNLCLCEDPSVSFGCSVDRENVPQWPHIITRWWVLYYWNFFFFFCYLMFVSSVEALTTYWRSVIEVFFFFLESLTLKPGFCSCGSVDDSPRPQSPPASPISGCASTLWVEPHVAASLLLSLIWVCYVTPVHSKCQWCFCFFMVLCYIIPAKQWCIMDLHCK